MRKPHTLTKVTSRDRPNNVIFFDTETSQVPIEDDKIQQVLKVGYVIRTRTIGTEILKIQKQVSFSKASTFWDLVDSWIRTKTKTYLVAHNIVFDLIVLDGFTNMLDRGWELRSFYSKGMTSIFRWSKDTKQLIMLDNTNFFPGKLAKWGDYIGVPKLEIDFKTATHEQLLRYNLQDVIIMVELWRTWIKFLDANDCGGFKFTIPSTALNTFRHRFMKHKVYIHSEVQALQLERNAYKGGRTEVLCQGEFSNDNFYYLDVNNLYGYILRNYTMPTALYGYRDKASIEILSRRLQKYLVIAEVSLDTDDNPFPYKINGRTAYPVGRYKTTLTTPELHLAVKRKWVKAVHSIAWYRHSKIFTEYVDYFYKLREYYRQQELSGFAEIAKLFVNSLYGKFGQLGLSQEQIGETNKDTVGKEVVFVYETGEKYYHIYIAGKVFKEVKEGESYNSFPAIAAHVTAYARMYMYFLLRTIPDKHCFYMDTDSFIVDSIGYKALEHLLDNHTLGKLKIELTSDWLTVNAPKDYSMEGRSRTKGIRTNAVMLSPGTYKQEQWSRLDGMINRGNLSMYTVKQIVKHQRREIYSGNVSSSGWVVPFVLG